MIIDLPGRWGRWVGERIGDADADIRVDGADLTGISRRAIPIALSLVTHGEHDRLKLSLAIANKFADLWPRDAVVRLGTLRGDVLAPVTELGVGVRERLCACQERDSQSDGEERATIRQHVENPCGMEWRARSLVYASSQARDHAYCEEYTLNAR